MSDDQLERTIRGTCYGATSTDVAELFRQMLRTYHACNSETGRDAAGELSERVFRTLPSIHRIGVADDLFSVYRLESGERLVWEQMLAKGAYNHCYDAQLVDARGESQRVVIKITVESDKDLRVYLLENVLHAILYQLPGTRAMVCPILHAFKVRKSGHPPYSLGTVMDNPGMGNLADWIDARMQNDEQMFSLLTQLAAMVAQGQRAVRLEHRDLKCDNVLLAPNPMAVSTVSLGADLDFPYPTLKLQCLLIDFGMARLELDDEYLACDCMHRRTDFNPSHDLQNLCCTMLEDHGVALAERAPRFQRWLAARCAPLFAEVRARWLDYDSSDSSTRHRRLVYVVNREKRDAFRPESMLADMKRHWQTRRRQ